MFLRVNQLFDTTLAQSGEMNLARGVSPGWKMQDARAAERRNSVGAALFQPVDNRRDISRAESVIDIHDRNV